ncbi:hypothetical protein [Undibacterium flavidum]|uniref:Uncharacterized protein n=1 Tax=Undibacterium flavidum TaxID=2762297 RepID=A0ABR6YG67_9BURK|nr:hypothetical protein [Undibacterium flavidum]MBC3875564.1 hypothetical protein [Undibacterium flavidum]
MVQVSLPITPLVLRDYLVVPDFVNVDQIAAGLSALNSKSASRRSQ